MKHLGGVITRDLSGQERENIKAADISEKEGQQTDNILLYYTQSCIVLLYTLAPDIDTNNGIMLW